MQLTIDADTWLKKKSVQSSTLPDSQKAFIEGGTTLEIKSFRPSFPQHRYVELKTPIAAADGRTLLKAGYIYTPHAKTDNELIEKNVIKLPAPYFSQLNNDTTYFGSGNRQCNTSSNAMLADFLLDGELSFQAGRQGLREAESLYGKFVAKHGDTVDHEAHTRALDDLGIESYFSYTLSKEDLIRSLREGIPVVVGFLYKSSGHICLLVGHDPKHRDWFVHDPYGIRFGASNDYEVGANGAYDVYSQVVMNQVFWADGPNTGWGRICTAVRGVPTGLPTGL